jgi:hypothetical protein
MRIRMRTTHINKSVRQAENEKKEILYGSKKTKNDRAAILIEDIRGVVCLSLVEPVLTKLVVLLSHFFVAERLICSSDILRGSNIHQSIRVCIILHRTCTGMFYG